MTSRVTPCAQRKEKANTAAKTLVSLSLLCLGILLSISKPYPALAKDRSFNNLPDRLFAGSAAPDKLSYPIAMDPEHDRVVPSPSEDPYFPVRWDNQPYMTMLDSSVNFTNPLNHFYYDPKWRGEVWGPFEQFSIVSKGERLMSTYPEYDEFSELRILNRWHKFWERASGYGP